jgi:hypothetical protein
VLCQKKIIFVDEKFSIISNISLQFPPTCGCFIGHSLLFLDSFGIQESRLDGSKTSLLSFSNPLNQHQIGRLLCDRVHLWVTDPATE